MDREYYTVRDDGTLHPNPVTSSDGSAAGTFINYKAREAKATPHSTPLFPSSSFSYSGLNNGPFLNGVKAPLGGYYFGYDPNNSEDQSVASRLEGGAFATLLLLGLVGLAAGAFTLAGVIARTGKGGVEIEEKFGDSGSDLEELIQNGEQLPRHTDVYVEADSHGNLPREGESNSSTDLYRDNKLVQRRYYDQNGKALRDVDYDHSNGDGSHTFPHTHDWTWDGDNSTRSGH